jgi:flagellar basal-body rod protein FlgF
MSGSVSMVSSSMTGLTERYRVITGNLANANTAGYKRRVNSQSTNAFPGEAGEIANQTSIDFTRGHLVRTGRSLDLALEGAGKGSFFVIETPEGPVYTRNGVFRLNAERQMVDAGGQTVGGGGGPITLPPSAGPSSIHVAGDGQISVGGQGIGKLQIVEFDAPAQLIPIGENCFRAPSAVTPKPTEDAGVCQGFQESSNVSVVAELVDLITVTRMYEANLKTVRARSGGSDSLLRVAMG